jgi:hypothetical protein
MAHRAGILAAATLGVGLVAGQAIADDALLKNYPGAKEQILSYYNANAREGSGNCGAGNIDDISNVKLVNESADSVVLAVQYGYSATVLGGNTAMCSGDSTREFTLAKGGSGWTVTNMTGATGTP